MAYAVPSEPKRREPPPVTALRDHGALCRQCREAAAAGLPPRALCAVGRLLARCALRSRARRAA